MKQARQRKTLERQLTSAAVPQTGMVAALCNRLARAIATHDPVSAGQARGALARLSLQHRGRLAQVRRTYHRTMALGADA